MRTTSLPLSSLFPFFASLHSPFLSLYYFLLFPVFITRSPVSIFSYLLISSSLSLSYLHLFPLPPPCFFLCVLPHVSLPIPFHAGLLLLSSPLSYRRPVLHRVEVNPPSTRPPYVCLSPSTHVYTFAYRTSRERYANMHACNCRRVPGKCRKFDASSRSIIVTYKLEEIGSSF